MTVRLVALHGFLGRASDWDDLAGRLPGVSLQALDLWKVLGESGAHDWETATSALDAALAAVAVQTEGPAAVPAASAAATRDMARSTFVVGYSLGARLALGSRLLSSPESPARGCCFVSCNPGLADADVASRRARRLSDDAWARRILEEPEDTLWQAWDAQPVFAGSARPETRGALPAPRDILARALGACSLAGQPDLRGRLRTWPSPVLWVTGDRDPKFGAIARELADDGMPLDFASCQDAGHRAPWDAAAAFAALIRQWMTDVGAGLRDRRSEWENDR